MSQFLKLILLLAAPLIWGCGGGAPEVVAQASGTKMHHVDFGFNITYLSRTAKYQSALDTLKKDGFKHVRAYEPFSPKLAPGNAKQLEMIKLITDRDLDLLLSLSNFPFEMLEESKRPNEIKDLKPELFKRMKKYTNRHAPADMASYGRSMRHMVSAIRDVGALNKIEFELGNEPEAPRYFWGDRKLWNEVTDTLMQILPPTGRPVYCCGFTSGFAHGLKEKAEFSDYLENDPSTKDLGLSYHVYLRSGKGELNLQEGPTIPMREENIITEFGIYTSFKEERISKVHSDKYLLHLMRLLDMCAKKNVTRVYLFPLMDNHKVKARFGLFDIDAKPKRSYEMAKMLNGVIQDGYTVIDSNRSIIIVGAKKSIIWAEEEIPDLGDHLQRNLNDSFGMTGPLSKDSWKILRK